jgi:hypothetical protein
MIMFYVWGTNPFLIDGAFWKDLQEQPGYPMETFVSILKS